MKIGLAFYFFLILTTINSALIKEIFINPLFYIRFLIFPYAICEILKTNKIVLKAQIHAGGRGKAGGIKIVNNINKLKKKYSKISIDTYDERLTSKIAKDAILLMGKNKKYRRKYCLWRPSISRNIRRY